jgi:putative long chain acyl-CoA synthase
MGRPLPGSAEVRIASYDIAERELVLGPDGFARQSSIDEIGMLLARVSRSEHGDAIPLRGVFARDDAWLATGDLFRRDTDGDFWRVDNIRDVIHTAEGLAFTAPIRDALTELPPVDLAVAYGVRPGGSEYEITVAAVTLRTGYELSARELGRTMIQLRPHRRPAIVHVVEEIPVTTWFRPVTGPLRDAGLPKPGEGVQAWYLDASGEHYRPLTSAARGRLVKSAA